MILSLKNILNKGVWAMVSTFQARGETTSLFGFLLTFKLNFMSDFKSRLLDEKQQLDEKKLKLESFINSDKFKDIQAVQMSLLNIQLQAMATYSQCLLERIAWLEETANV